MSRVDRIDSDVLFRRMVRETRREGFRIKKVPYIGPGNNEDTEQLGRCYPGHEVWIVDGMPQWQEDYVVLHELAHSQGTRSKRITRRVAHEIDAGLSPSQRRKLHRAIPPNIN